MSEVFRETWNTYDGFVNQGDWGGTGRRQVLVPVREKNMLTQTSVPGIARKGHIDSRFAKKLIAAGNEADHEAVTTEQKTALSGLVNQLLETDISCMWNVQPYQPSTPKNIISDEMRLILPGAIAVATYDVLTVNREPIGDEVHDALTPVQAIIGIKATVPARLASMATGTLACGIVTYDYQPPQPPQQPPAAQA